jgi:hypothetical protein
MKRLGPVCLMISVAACGGKTATPSPTAPAATATSLTISGTDTLRTGQSQTYTANINLSNGSSQAATATWATDNAGVVSVTNAGAATGLTQGAATLSASAQGVSATRAVTVWQDYQGTWIGSYRVRACTERGGFVGLVCRSTFPVGTLLPVRVILAQTGASASGTVELGEIVSTLSGAIFSSRRFVGAGSGSFSEDGFTFNTSIGTFDALSTATTLTGSLVITMTVTGLAGNIYLEADFSGVTRTSALVQPSRLTPTYRSLPELLQGFTRE